MQLRLCVVAMATMFAGPVVAAPQATTLAFTANNIGFLSGFGGAVTPPASVSGSFTFMFDFASPPAVAVQTPVTSVSFTAGGHTYTAANTFFEYPSVGGALDTIGFGAIAYAGDAIGSIGVGTGDFRLSLGAFGGPFNAQIKNLIFAVPGEAYLFESNDISYTVATVAGAVPEPATWTLMIGGFGMVGATMRHRAVRTAAVTA